LERVASGKAHRVDLPDQVFSRVHVDDIVAGLIAGFDAPAGAYNLADDRPCNQNAVMEEAARLLGVYPPSFVSLETLSPQARAFYAENRRVANGKAKRVLGWTPDYPDFVAGLGALRATSSPTIATPPPAAASAVQR
jgi:nucleoside-diphosphate-sugar epimerase